MVNPSPFLFRPARRSDVPAIVRLLADDVLGAAREQATDPLPTSYYTAFDAIHSDPRHELVVVEVEGEVVGTLQLTFLPGLPHRGATRAQIEAVRVDRRLRGQGVGQQLFEWAIARARAEGCHLIQLTTDTRRTDAARFYEHLGFVPSHVGMKLHL